MKGTVYKIIALQSNDIYIGSTCGHLNDRWYRHKKGYKEWLKTKQNHVSSFNLFEKYGVDNCRIVPIKEYEVFDRRQLETFETIWICKLKSINKTMPVGLTEFFQKERDKRRYEENKEAIAERRKPYFLKYYEENKEELCEYQKQYYNENKEEILERNRQYRVKNKEAIAEKEKEKFHCDVCNIDITKKRVRRHNLTQKHINNLNRQSDLSLN